MMKKQKQITLTKFVAKTGVEATFMKMAANPNASAILVITVTVAVIFNDFLKLTAVKGFTPTDKPFSTKVTKEAFNSITTQITYSYLQLVTVLSA